MRKKGKKKYIEIFTSVWGGSYKRQNLFWLKKMMIHLWKIHHYVVKTPPDKFIFRLHSFWSENKEMIRAVREKLSKILPTT